MWHDGQTENMMKISNHALLTFAFSPPRGRRILLIGTDANQDGRTSKMQSLPEPYDRRPRDPHSNL